MLERLDAVNWKKLKHAYGSAKDVPDLIRQLASADAEKRAKARYDLYGNIFHQGTRYQATPYAIPFLVELLVEPSVPERHELPFYLISLALGYAESFLPDGVDPAELRHELRKADRTMSAAERKECEKYGFSAQANIDCYDGVMNAVPLFLQFLEDPDDSLASSCAYAVAWFPERSALSVPRLLAALGEARSERWAVHALLSLGLLSRKERRPEVERLLRDRIVPGGSPTVQTAAAIAACTALENDLPFDVLLAAPALRAEFKRTCPELLFNDGDLAGYAMRVLASIPADRRAAAIETLVRALPESSIFHALDTARSLLMLAEGDGDSGGFRGRRFAALTPLQQRALQALAEREGWSMTTGQYFLNFGQLVASFGLPDTQEKLRDFIAAG